MMMIFLEIKEVMCGICVFICMRLRINEPHIEHIDRKFCDGGTIFNILSRSSQLFTFTQKKPSRSFSLSHSPIYILFFCIYNVEVSVRH